MEEKKTMRSEKDSRKEEKMRGASGDLLEQHSAACGGMKGGHIASPRRTGDPPYPSFCSWIKNSAKIHSWVYSRNVKSVCYIKFKKGERNLTVGDKESWGRERMGDRLPAADRKMSAIKRRSSILECCGSHGGKKGAGDDIWKLV